MNRIVIILSVICLGLLVALVVCSQRAAGLLEAAHAETGTISNQLNEAQMKLNHQERLNASLKSQLEERESAQVRSSNELAQLRSTLATLRGAAQTAQAEIDKLAASGAAIASERDGLSLRIHELDAELRERELELAGARQQSVSWQNKLANQSHQLAALDAEKRRLEGQLNNQYALENQLITVHQEQAAMKTPGPAGKPDYRLPLQLQSDGSVTIATNPPNPGEQATTGSK